MPASKKQLRKLYELSLLLSGEPDEIIHQIASMIAEFYNVRVVVLTEIRDKELHFLCASVDGELKTSLGHLPLEFAPGVLLKEGKKNQFFNQLSEVFSQIDFLKQKKTSFYFGEPAIASSGNVILTACLLGEKYRDLSEESIDLLRIFGQRIAMELERKSALVMQSATEIALKNSQSQLYNLTNISPVGIFRTNVTGQCIYVNALWCQFSGMTIAQVESDGWMQAVHPEDRSLIINAWDKSLKQNQNFELEHRYLTPQNKVTWVVGRVAAEKNSEGEVVGYIGVVTDISKRKKQEMISEEIYQKLLQAQNIAHLGFFEYNLETDETYWSEETYRIFGTNPQQTTPNFESFSNFVHPEDFPLIKGAREQLESGVLYDTDYRIVKPDGSESILHGQAKIYFDERIKQRKIVGTVQDVSERKYVENALNALAEFSVIDDVNVFYKSMAYNLARAYNAQYAFLGLFAEDNKEAIVVQAIWIGSDFGENFQYELKGTPCADVINHQMEMVLKNVACLYPEDLMLAEMGIESYFGAPLITPSGKKIGLVVVMDTKSMYKGQWSQSILSLFAQQIASHIEHNRGEKEIKNSQKTLSSILDNMLDVYSRTDKDGVLTMMSPAGTAILGYQINDVLGAPLAALYLNPDDHDKLLQALNDNNGRVHNFTVALRHKDEHTVWMSTNAQYYYDEQGNILGVEGITRDITQQYFDELQMKKMSSALEQTADMVLIADKQGIIEYVNPMFEKITGYSKDELIGKTPNILNSGEHEKDFYKNMWKTILRGDVFTDVLVNKKQDGSIFHQDEIITPLKNDDGEITHFIATGRDISKRIENQKRLQYIAHHDALTSLPNRVLFMDRIKRSLVRAKRNHERVAVLFFDLDRFKNINDTLGHLIGDKLLIEIAQRLKKDVREDDSIARLGGDEFAVLLDKVRKENDVTHIAHKILSSLEKSVMIDGHSLYTTASIGISLFPDDGEDAGTLLKNADIAMYRAKDTGKNNYQFYSKEMSARAIQRLAMENSLRMALKNNEFVLHYQPQVDAKSHAIIGVEALIRWQHSKLGLILPANFIPLLEETGLIVDVGDWVLEAAFEQLKAWSLSGYDDLTMSVNVSSRQFHGQNFYNRIVEMTKKYNLLPEKIELEITESILMDKQMQTIENINKLDSYGFRMAIDDFGTGYSSLSYLQRFKINTLKIDRTFIKDVVSNADDAKITTAIIAMAHSLKLNIVAEGVETQQQLDFLQQQDCQLIQGYFFSQPLAAEPLTKLLEGGFLPPVADIKSM
ncbi:diguanylate cyclase/phosphodiesterase (GGDEF & EAL domains) with PAS/PAC sensor(s) [hydrothermal vent metagenome]|uniref:Diguanylate cyclase/phosphodiesterase (GGDEF & EAL domains) with PAS/PAC sensor(S) n=1 Tax=hydrothermal vent metagenome TaxID=652676 RepID=A0A3B0W5B2_9ZZZZ